MCVLEACSRSLLHVPVDLSLESKLDPDLRSWLAFAVQKLEEVRLLGQALIKGRQSVHMELQANQDALNSRAASPRVHSPAVGQRMSSISPQMMHRASQYPSQGLSSLFYDFMFDIWDCCKGHPG